MANVLIVVYLLIVLALIAVILLQRSEGGALGIGGGGGGGMAKARTSANLLTRTTAILGVLFFATAIGLTVVNEVDSGSESILESAASGGQSGSEGSGSVLDALNSMQGETSGGSQGDDSLAVPEDTGSAGSSSSETQSSQDSGTNADAPDLAVPESGSEPSSGGSSSTGSGS